MASYRVNITGDPLQPQPWHADGDPLWVTVRPNLRRIHVLAGDILAALGKSREVGGKGRNQSQDVHLAAAWLRAHHCPALVVVDAQRLDPRILASLTRLAELAVTDLYLLHRPPITDATHRAIFRRTTAELPPGQVPAPATKPMPPVTTPEARFAVPRHDFHTFLAAARTHVPADHRDAVIADFADTMADTCHRIASSTNPQAETALALVGTITAAHPDTVLTTRLRAIQRAAWDHDLHVSVDLDLLLASQERPRTPTGQAATELLHYRQPYRGIAWHLSHHHVGVTEIAQLPISAACPDGSAITCSTGTIAIPAALEAAVRAQLAIRAAEAADTGAPLLPYTPKTIAKTLTSAAADLGLPAHGRLAERQTLQPERWLKKLGVTIRTLR